MRSVVRGMMVVAVMLTVTGMVVAGGAREADFPAELETALQEQGLTEEEAAAIVEAAESYDWQGADRADPALEPAKNAVQLWEEQGYTAREQARQRSASIGDESDEEVRRPDDAGAADQAGDAGSARSR